MALKNLMGDIALNDTSELIAILINALLDKTPIPDTNDRMRVNIEAGTLPVVSTVSTVTNATNLNNFAGGNTTLIPFQLGAGAFHLYNNIIVS